MHGGLLHLGGNMLFLWVFGNNIEDAMGRVKFVAFYLLGGLVATLSHTVIDTSSTIPSIGASGAVAAVLGGYALLYPRARVVTLDHPDRLHHDHRAARSPDPRAVVPVPAL